MNQITVMAIVVIMASIWEYSNAGIRISGIVEYSNALRINLPMFVVFTYYAPLFFITFASRSGLNPETLGDRWGGMPVHNDKFMAEVNEEKRKREKYTEGTLNDT